MHPYDSIIVSKENAENLEDNYIYYLMNNLFEHENYFKLGDIVCYTHTYDEIIISAILENNNVDVLDIYIENNRRYQDINHELLPILLNSNRVISAYNWVMCIGTHAEEMLNILINNPKANESPIIYAYWIKNKLYHYNALKLKIIEYNMIDEIVELLNSMYKKTTGYEYIIDDFYSTLPDYMQLNIIV